MASPLGAMTAPGTTPGSAVHPVRLRLCVAPKGQGRHSSTPSPGMALYVPSGHSVQFSRREPVPLEVALKGVCSKRPGEQPQRAAPTSYARSA